MPSHPAREIRASYDGDTIAVYQAYPARIASAAVAAQKLSASDAFKLTRMTWIKPSWCWMMYRCGYSYKDVGQERVLALRMKHADFHNLLRDAQLSHQSSADDKGQAVRVQWDPERGPRLERLEWRSIQVGIPPSMIKEWVEQWIVGIEDVTEMARGMKKALDEDTKGEVTQERLVQLGLFPTEKVYAVPDDIVQRLGMSAVGPEGDAQ